MKTTNVADPFLTMDYLARSLYRGGHWVEASKVYEEADDYYRAMYCLHRAIEKRDGLKSANYRKIAELYAKVEKNKRSSNYVSYANYQLRRESVSFAKNFLSWPKKASQAAKGDIATSAIIQAPVEELPPQLVEAKKVPVERRASAVSAKEEPKTGTPEVSGTLAEFPEYVPFVQFLAKRDPKWRDPEFVDKQIEIANMTTSGPIKEMHFGEFCYEYFVRKYGASTAWKEELNEPRNYYHLAEKLRVKGSPLNFDPNDMELKLALLTSSKHPKKDEAQKDEAPKATTPSRIVVGLGRKPERPLIPRPREDKTSPDTEEGFTVRSTSKEDFIKEINVQEREIKKSIAYLKNGKNRDVEKLTVEFQKVSALLEEWRSNLEIIDQYDKKSKHRYWVYKGELEKIARKHRIYTK